METDREGQPTDGNPLAQQVAVLTQLLQDQMVAAEARDRQLANVLQQVLTPSTPTQAATVSSASASPQRVKPTAIAAERPMLLSSSTLSDFTAWQEAFHDYSQCQHLTLQDKTTRVSALRQCFDEDLRRFIREGIIPVAQTDDVEDIMKTVKAYIRRQRNPLLDRIEFYKRKQSRGESFDAFYTTLKELHNSCDFADSTLCSTCSGTACHSCRSSLAKLSADVMRDRIVTGIYDDETRHKLLASTDLTLDEAIKICRAEESATTTTSCIPQSGQVNAVRKTAYQKRKVSGTTSSKPDSESSTSTSPEKCPNCGRDKHVKPAVCPASGKRCNHCHGMGHFQSVCRKKTNRVGQLKLQRASAIPSSTIPANTTLQTQDTSHRVDWVPDTGSDVDAVGPRQLSLLGGFPENLDEDNDVVTSASGERLSSLGCIKAKLAVGDVTHDTTIHVFEHLQDALMSRQSLRALGYLPLDWPKQICRTSLSPQGMTSVDCRKIREDLLQEFSDVFDTEMLKPMHGPDMNIVLEPTATPSHQSGVRPIPYAYREQVRAQLDDMVQQQIIEPVAEPSDWCHPIVIVEKRASTEKRLTVDFKRLNDQVKRPTHPMVSPREAVCRIEKARYFTKLDARHGYWQIPLSEESRNLTVFMTPWGRYRYLRNPQGLISAGDEFNRRTDEAFERITNMVKVVDDCLVYDDDFDSHLEHVREVLQCAREHGITLSPKKFEFALPEVDFCGYIVNRDGYTVDKSKTAGIGDFPVPKNRSDLRSFLGLVNQCNSFSTRLSELSQPLRPLLKTSNVFLWEHDHTSAFNSPKDELLSPPVLSHFQVGQPLRLETDASVLKGLGFVLWQKQADKWCLIQCGSRHITDTESRYAVIELEMLGVVWAVQKCSLYLSGAQFELIVDHRPLVPILNSYRLDRIENRRLLRLVLKLQLFQFKAEWRKGSNHVFADALSRNPVDQPVMADLLGEDDPENVLSPSVCLCQLQDGNVYLTVQDKELQDAAKSDVTYQQLVKYVHEGFPDSCKSLPSALQPFWNGRDQLTLDNGLVLKGQRIVVPVDLRQKVLTDLHASYQGIVRTKRRARQTVYWPSITRELEDAIRSCSECRERQASQPHEPLMADRKPSFPLNMLVQIYSIAKGGNT